MQLHSTVRNDDGTFSLTYTKVIQDIAGNSVEVLAEVHTYSLDDLNTEIQNVTDRVTSYQQTLASLQVELAAITAL